MTAPVAIGVAACAGRTGRSIVAAVVGTPGCRLAGGSQYDGHPAVGQDAASLAGEAPVGAVVTGDPAAMMANADVVIDFSTPAGTAAHLRAALATDTPLVVGTTGLDAAARRALVEASRALPILVAPNMSTGATLLTELTRRLAGILGDDYDIEVLGLQHRHKVDAPSGTALGLARAAAAGRGLDPETIGATPRDGHIGARPAGMIGLATVHGGDVPGEHTVIFAGPGERLELAHRPSSLGVYARGAVRAALWLAAQKPGYYGMSDVLGLTQVSARTHPSTGSG
ncbi:MAG: 4-hydroxy-tetrahydrodipicolinate reductase [Alphaproteobacteria bacterium]|nr:4-hydroxy-tetrahydrodipicolinate reductase [Alphaproteobacteria bacterium]